MPKPKVLVIVGPTASGKSGLAIRLAKRFNGEVISADSRQVYRGLEIGSGRLEVREMRGIKHHLLGIVSPKKVFSVSDFQKLATKKIEEILKRGSSRHGRGKLPIICGGTGFYIQSIVDGIILPEVKPNLKLRKELEKLSVKELFEKLKVLDPARAKNIDANNPRRLIRAIEIATKLGKVPKLQHTKNYRGDTSVRVDFIQIGIKVTDEILRKKINQRLARWFKQGLLNEVKKLRKQKISFKRIKEFGLEYFYVAEFLEGKISKQEMIMKSQTAIYQYAKRQMTWFKRDKRINWIPAGKSAIVDALGFIVQW
ncbi:MAG: tRNA (adenosine(37)-N6)-dimethylallyltransferase MiaA [Patescibacteria group bacterium]